MPKRRYRPVEGDPFIDFIDSSLESIEQIRYELKTLRSDLLVIRKVALRLTEEHNERIIASLSTDSDSVASPGADRDTQPS